jgi:hypothetical protein
MRRLLPLAVLALPLALTFCEDDNTVIPVTSAAVQAVDDCDSVSFNAALGAGTCQKAGATTFDAFANELAATGRVTKWAFAPATLQITVRGIVQVTNRGGEQHTFTQVANYGGGIDSALNAASGTLVVAPECLALESEDFIQPGALYATDRAPAAGVAHYQCCIHPWMRAEVTIAR